MVSQRVEEKVFRKTDEKTLIDLLSEENKKKANAYFHESFCFKCIELGETYNAVMNYLLEELVVKEGKIVPKRIAEPAGIDIKYLELYSALSKLDECFADYKSFHSENESSKSNTNDKIRLARERLEKVKAKKRETKEKLEKLDSSGKTWSRVNVEETKLKKEIENCDEEEENIEEQISGYQTRIGTLHRERMLYFDKSPLRCYYEFALLKAGELGLERTLEFIVADTPIKETVIIDSGLLASRLEGIPVEWVLYKQPKTKRPIKLIYKLGALAAGVMIAVVGTYSLVSKDDAEKNPGTVTIENAPIVNFNARTMEVEYEVPGHGKVKQKLPAIRIEIPTEKYLPGKIEIAKFDPEAMDLTIRNTKHDEELTSNLGENFQIGKQFIAITDYRQEGNDPFNITEIITVYGLDETGGFGPVKEGLPNNPSERKVPKEEIMDYLRGIAQTYKTKPITQADIFVKDKK